MESTVWIAASVILLALPGLRLGLRRVDVADLSGGVVAQCCWGLKDPFENIAAVYEEWEEPLPEGPAGW